jgi:hypothetical protein
MTCHAQQAYLDGVLIQQLGLPLAPLALANIPALGGLRVGAHDHAGVAAVHPSGGIPLRVPSRTKGHVPGKLFRKPLC